MLERSQKNFWGYIGMPELVIPSTTGVVLTPDKVLIPDTSLVTNPPVDGPKFAPFNPVFVPPFKGRLMDANPGHVSRPLPGQLLAADGIGEFLIPHIGVRGSMIAEVLTGEPGAARAVLKLTSAPANALNTIQISLDTQNRPVLTVAFLDAAGAVTLKTSNPGGPAIPEGALVQVQVNWDSIFLLKSGRHLDFKLLNGRPVPGNLGGIPNIKVPWPTIPMHYVLVGLGTNLFDFNDTSVTLVGDVPATLRCGTILNIQVGDQRVDN